MENYELRMFDPVSIFLSIHSIQTLSLYNYMDIFIIL